MNNNVSGLVVLNSSPSSLIHTLKVGGNITQNSGNFIDLSAGTGVF
jgi:hypothetical protein